MLKYYGLYPLRISDFEALQKALPQGQSETVFAQKIIANKSSFQRARDAKAGAANDKTS